MAAADPEDRSTDLVCWYRVTVDDQCTPPFPPPAPRLLLPLATLYRGRAPAATGRDAQALSKRWSASTARACCT